MKTQVSAEAHLVPGALKLSALALIGWSGNSNGQSRVAPTPNSSATPSLATPSPATPTAPAFSLPLNAPTGVGTIVFVSNRDGNNEIYSMRADGSAQTRLTNSPAPDDSPSRSRDGKRIVFSSLRTGNPEIYTMGIAGETSNLLRLTADTGASPPADTQPTFSADGTQIAWISTRGGSANVWIMSSTGTNQRQLTFEGNVASPAFSPSGREIAFSVARPPKGIPVSATRSILVARNIVSGAESVVARGAFSAHSPRYNPSGNRLTFTALTPGSGERRLRVVDLSTRTVADAFAPSSAAGFASGAAFSPDGRHLVCEVAGPQSPQIGLSTASSGASATLLTSQGGNFSPSWGP